MNRVTHFQDEEFIAYLNDATGVWQRRRIRRHIASCLECRYRLNLLETEIRDIIAAAQAWSETDLLAVERARKLFRERLAQEQARPEPAPHVSFLAAGGSRLRYLAALSFALLLLGAWTAWTMVSRTPSDPLAKARSIEDRNLTRAAVRQEFELSLSPNAPPRKIEVLFDPRANRFSLTLRNADHSLAYGLWRPSPDRALEYYSANSEGLRPLRPATCDEEEARFASNLAAGNPDMERILVWWLEKRAVAPIRLSSEGLLVPSLAKLGRPGSVRDIEDLFLLQWRTVAMKRPSLLTLSIDASNYRPVSQSLRYEAAHVEMKLTLIQEQQVPPESLDRSEFEPSPSLIMAKGPGILTPDLLATVFRLSPGGLR